MVSVGHLRVRSETGARAWVLLLAICSSLVVLITFVFTTLVDEPATARAIGLILLLSIGLDFGWKWRRDARLSDR